MKVKKKANPVLSILKFCRDYWPILSLTVTVVGGFIYTFANLPKRVEAVEKQVSQVAKWIDNQEQIKEKINKAPPGWIWDEKLEKYVEDSNYIPPKKRAP